MVLGEIGLVRLDEVKLAQILELSKTSLSTFIFSRIIKQVNSFDMTDMTYLLHLLLLFQNA